MSTEVKREYRMRLPWIFGAWIFLWNPNCIVIDVLPDWMGYLFLCFGLSKLADLNDSIGTAVSAFRKMIWIDAAKLLAMVWIFGMSAASERTSSMLLWTFVFSVLELIFVIPAFSKLFDGLTEIGYFYPNVSLFGTELSRKGGISGERPKKKNRTDRMKRQTVFFVAMKAILAVLPEFSELTNLSYDEGTGTVGLYRYIGVMRVMAVIPVLIVGIVWLIRMTLYLRSILKDRALMIGLYEKYQADVKPKVGLFAQRNVKSVCALTVAALILTLDFRLDGQNCFPDFWAAILMFFAFLVLKKREKDAGRRWLAATLCYFFFSVLGAVAEYSFFSRYSYGALIKNEAAMRNYGILLGLNVGKYISFLLVLLCLVGCAKKMIQKHTGSVLGKESVSERECAMAQTMQKELTREFWLAFAGAAFYGIADLCRDLLLPDFPFFEMVPWIFGVICIGLWIRAFLTLQRAVTTKYMLE